MHYPKNIFAYTPVDPVYPPFVSLNEQKGGGVVLTCRGVARFPGEHGNTDTFTRPGHTVDVSMPQDELVKLHAELGEYLVGKRIHASTPE